MHELPGRIGRLTAAVTIAAIVLTATAAPAAALSTSYPVLSTGNRGANVLALQHLLRARGVTIAVRVDDSNGKPPMFARRTIAVTGVFDRTTEQAVRAFQATQGRSVTGLADRATWEALVVALQPGDTGEAVAALQRLLVEKRRADITLNARYDSATRTAVIAFQRHIGITATGSVGPTFWRRLVAHLELPVYGDRLCAYEVGNGNAKWGTSEAIAQIQAAASRVVAEGHGRVGIGDVGREHGGDIRLHQTHEQGMDIDIRAMRDAKDQCRWGVTWRWSSYDRAATRALVKAIRATAPGHVKVIYFNDPVLIREGLVTWYAGHDDHLHVRYCERVHAAKAYDC